MVSGLDSHSALLSSKVKWPRTSEVKGSGSPVHISGSFFKGIVPGFHSLLEKELCCFEWEFKWILNRKIIFIQILLILHEKLKPTKHVHTP